MGTRAEILDTNIDDISKQVTHVNLEYGNIIFRGESIFQNKSIFLGAATAILLLDTDKFNTVFKIEFNDSKFLVLSCKTDYYLKNIKTFRLNYGEQLEVNKNISSVGALSAFFTVALLFSFFIDGESYTAPQVASKSLTQNDKSKICKAYIGEMFSKPVSIIDNYKNNGDLVYVSYVRSVDNTKWSYVCDLSEGTITWATWLNDTEEWGRWRHEDETSLDYNASNKTISFIVQGSRVTVQL